MKSDVGITVKKNEDIAQWYEQVCLKSELADFGDVKGTIVMRPRSYFIWQQVQDFFNTIITKEFQVDNCSFPMFIPERFFKKEAEHAQGFAPELAWIQATDNTDLQNEKAIIRPTSETIIADSFRKWLRNYKQLPIKVNQWCNIVRWEVKQTKLFLRSREFLWQEGHCIYETNEECQKDVEGILDSYVRVCKDLLALPVITGEKTEAERFPGASKTYTIEGIMPDGKALQMGTSHNLGQGFMKAFDVEYMGSDEKKHYPFYNSWGISTRLLGALVMTHSDDKGLVLPPKLVKNKVCIVPIKRKNMPEGFDEYVQKIVEELEEFGAYIDNRDEYSFGWKLNEAELKGTPVAIIIGTQEMEKGVCTVKMRDQSDKEQIFVENIKQTVSDSLKTMHTRLYDTAKSFLDSHIKDVDSIEDMQKVIADGNLASVYFCGSKECEHEVEEKYGIGSRCIKDANAKEGKCLFSQKPTTLKVLFGRSY